MEKNTVLEAVKKLKSIPKRKFEQTVDLIINLKDLNLKNPDQQIEFFATVHHSPKKLKICAFAGPELLDEAKANVDNAVSVEEFEKYQNDKKLAKKLANENDFFIAQANIMAKVATAFGKVLGPRGKMPNPKAGCVVPPKTALKPLYEKLQKTIKISAKTSLVIQIPVGKESMPDEQIVENISDIFTQLERVLPGGRNNIRSTFLKLTMSEAVKI